MIIYLISLSSSFIQLSPCSFLFPKSYSRNPFYYYFICSLSLPSLPNFLISFLEFTFFLFFFNSPRIPVVSLLLPFLSSSLRDSHFPYQQPLSLIACYLYSTTFLLVYITRFTSFARDEACFIKAEENFNNNGCIKAIRLTYLKYIFYIFFTFIKKNVYV